MDVRSKGIHEAEAETTLVDMDPSIEDVEKSQNDFQELLDALEGVEDAPSLGDLETWKSVNGKFYASSILADDNIYIWKTLKRNEYKSLLGSGATRDELTYQDAVVRKCLLYPKPSQSWMITQDAGTIPSLFKQIMYKSGFVSEEMALTLINVI